MKLATYRDGSRDGQLVVVSRDLSSAHYASHIANRLQQLLDDWNFIAPQLQQLYEALNAGRARHAFPFDAQHCMAPLPRTGLVALADAYDSDLLAAPPADPGLRLVAGDALAGACDPVRLRSEQLEIDFGAGLAVVTGDVAAGAGPEQALDGVRLLTLHNALCLHAAGLSPVQRHPATAFGPVAVTLDELGDAWAQGRVHLNLQTGWNGRRIGLADAGADMRWHFGELMAQLCAARPLAAGSIVCGGTVRARGVADGARPAWPKGAHALADRRAIELRQDGAASTGFLRLGDSVSVELKGVDGASLCGAIAQEIVPATEPERRPAAQAA